MLQHAFLDAVAQVGGTGSTCTAEHLAAALRDLAAATPGGIVTAIPGRFGVAENGAVYVDADDLDERVTIVRSEHLVLTVPAAAIVATMHEAVRRLPRASRCGWFLSGPSKTADIEQALVIGAQGARTVDVFLIT
jgi:L-lactate utilization protein LutC